MDGNAGGPLNYWAKVDDQAEIYPALSTLIIIDTEAVGP